MDKTLTNAAGAPVPANQEPKTSTESKCPVAGGARRPTEAGAATKDLLLDPTPFLNTL